MRDSTEPTSLRTEGFEALGGLLEPLPAAPDGAFGPLAEAEGGELPFAASGAVDGGSPGNALTSEDDLPSSPPDVPGTGVGGGPGTAPGFAPAPVAGLSTLPRMMGRPSLPEPTMTILVFGDCAKASVALIPCQRR